MSERARIFDALMRHLWCYWLGEPSTTKNFFVGDLNRRRTHIQHALLLAQRLERDHSASVRSKTDG